MNWRLFAIIASVVAVMLAAILAFGRPAAVATANASTGIGALFVAQLAPAGQPPVSLAYLGGAGSFRISRFQPGPGTHGALWLVTRENAVFPMGALTTGDSGTTINLTEADRRRIGTGQSLQLTVVPDSEARLTRPTTPVVARAPLVAI